MKTYLSSGVRVFSGYVVQTKPTQSSIHKIDSYGSVGAASELIHMMDADAVIVEPKHYGIRKRFGKHFHSISKASSFAKSIGLDEIYDIRRDSDVPSSFLMRIIKSIF
jgi:hypothetical protein